MSDTAAHGKAIASSDVDPDELPPIKPLTAEEAQALRSKHPPVSPWRAVGLQAMAGVVCVGVAWALAPRGAAAVSALYGAACAVLPNALMAWGLTRGTNPSNPTALAFRFMVWEWMKLGLSVVMLLLAPMVVPGLVWPALLAGLIVCLKAGWLAFLWRRKP